MIRVMYILTEVLKDSSNAPPVAGSGDRATVSEEESESEENEGAADDAPPVDFFIPGGRVEDGRERE